MLFICLINGGLMSAHGVMDRIRGKFVVCLCEEVLNVSLSGSAVFMA